MHRLLAVPLLWAALAAPSPAPGAEAAPNANRHPAGRWSHDTLFVTLDARDALWRPDEGDSPPAAVQAFADASGAASVPGPLIRVRSGTTIVATVRNSVKDSALVMHGLLAYPSATDDTVQVAAGKARTVTFRAGAPGTYLYWGTTEHAPSPDQRATGPDAALGGAFVIDPATGPVPDDRIFVITQILFEGDSTKPQPNWERFEVAINGRAWPHTERLDYAQGDTVRWRWVNSGWEAHPMHLHGFFFRIDARSGLLADTLYAPDRRRLAVTERMDPGTTMLMTWVPDRAGNWLFHCHIAAHVNPGLVYPFPGDSLPHYPSPSGAPPTMMGGLILGITVTPRAGFAAPAPTLPPRDMRMVLRELPFLVDSFPAVSVALGDSAQFGRTHLPHDVPVPTLVLTRGQTTRIRVVNHMSLPAAVHWHGLEIESYSDGVPGWSGTGSHIAPLIAPGDSFTAELTPPRAGTFIYHSHIMNGESMASGLYGALLVVEPGAAYDSTRDIVLLFGGGDPPPGRSLYLNGSLTPAPRTLTAGVTYRVRLIDISDNFGVHVMLTFGAKPVAWRAIAKDGADLPAGARTVGPADAFANVGETYDFEFTPARPGDYYLEIVRPTGVVNRQLWRVRAP